jgi:hypothetical protein
MIKEWQTAMEPKLELLYAAHYSWT